MKVDLDIFELSWLLDCCLRGSHLRSGTIERFVDDWYDKLTQQERYNLYEWSLRLTYSYHKEFKPSDTCCGKDIIFMKRFDPENQYKVTVVHDLETTFHRAFLMEGKYYISSRRFIEEKYIVKVEKFVPEVERTDFELNFKGRRN